MVNKPKLGVFGITGCGGCILSFLYQNMMPVLHRFFDIVAFPMIMENNDHKLDIAFVEGTVTCDEDIIALNEIRKRSKILVALGSCACFGGVPAMKNFLREREIEKFVYPSSSHLKSVKATPLDMHVKVDYYIPQCPPNKKEITKFLACYLNGKKFELSSDPVCIECRRKGNTCLLEEGKICLGPVTAAGCDALCPSKGIACYGCRGPNEENNIEAFIKLLKEKGFDEAEIKTKLSFFAGLQFEKKWQKK